MNEKESPEHGSASASEILQNVEEEIGSVLSIMEEYSSILHQSQEKLKTIKSQISRVNEFLNHYSSMSKKIVPVVVRRISGDEEGISANAQAFLSARRQCSANASVVRRYCTLHQLGSTSNVKSDTGVSTSKHFVDSISQTSDNDGSQQNSDIEIIEQPEKRDGESTGNVQKRQRTEAYASKENNSAAKDIHMALNAEKTSTTSTTTPAQATAEKEQESSRPDEPEEICKAIDATKGILTPAELRTFIYLVPQVDEPLLMTKVSFTTDIPLLYFQLMSLKYNIAKEYAKKESGGVQRCEEARLLEAKIESFIEMVRKDVGVI